jgi:hypothetical protein
VVIVRVLSALVLRFFHAHNPGLRGDAAVIPPSKVKSWFAANEDSSDANQTAMEATSAGVPKRFTAWRASASAFALSRSFARSKPAT